jgi:hypothetical protein
MNDVADHFAGACKYTMTKWQNPIDKFCLTIQNKNIFEQPQKAVYKHITQLQHDNWIKRQPKYSAFTHPAGHPIGRPHKNDPYANLTCRILTGTIWTNKLKKRCKLSDTDTCLICQTDSLTQIESHQHILGECPNTTAQRRQHWNELTAILHHHNLNSSSLYPWFTHPDYPVHGWDLPIDLCHKGLIPTQVIANINANNKGANTRTKTTAKKELAYKWREITRTIYLDHICAAQALQKTD